MSVMIAELQHRAEKYRRQAEEYRKISSMALSSAHHAIYLDLKARIDREIQLEARRVANSIKLTPIQVQGLYGTAGLGKASSATNATNAVPSPPPIRSPIHSPRPPGYMSGLMAVNKPAWNSPNTINPQTRTDRRILQTYLVYDLVKKRKYVAQRSAKKTTFEEVDTDRPHTHTSYDLAEKLLPVKHLEFIQLRYYIDKGTYNEVELRVQVLKAIKCKKNVFTRGEIGESASTEWDRHLSHFGPPPDIHSRHGERKPPDQKKIDTFKSICKRFDKCEKLVKMADVRDYTNLNEAKVAYRMLMKEYEIIITVLMSEGGDEK